MLLTLLDPSLLLSSLAFSALGILILLITFVVIEKLTPKHSLWKEIVEQKNTALALVVAAFILAMSIIIASAIH